VRTSAIHHPSCPGPGADCICPQAPVVWSCPWCVVAFVDRAGGDDVEALRRYEDHLDTHQLAAAVAS
jgi:hypothetical protein